MNINPFKSDPHADAAKHRQRIVELEAKLAGIGAKRTTAAEAAATAAADGLPFDVAAMSSVDSEEATLRAALGVLRDRLAVAEKSALAADLAQLEADRLAIAAQATADRDLAAGAICAALSLFGAAGGSPADVHRLLDTHPTHRRDPMAALRLRAAALGRGGEWLVTFARDARGSDPEVQAAADRAAKALGKLPGAAALLAQHDADRRAVEQAQAAADAAAKARTDAVEADRVALIAAMRRALVEWPLRPVADVAADPEQRQVAHDLLHLGLERLGRAGVSGEFTRWIQQVDAAGDRLGYNFSLKPLRHDRLRTALGMSPMAPT